MSKVSFSDFKKVDIKNINFSEQTNFNVVNAGRALGRGAQLLARRAGRLFWNPTKKFVTRKGAGVADAEALTQAQKLVRTAKSTAKDVASELKSSAPGKAIGNAINKVSTAAKTSKVTNNVVVDKVKKAAGLAKDAGNEFVAKPIKAYVKGQYDKTANAKGLIQKGIKGTLATGGALMTASLAPMGVGMMADAVKNNQMSNNLFGVDPNKYYAVEQDYQDPSKIRVIANKKGYDNRDNAVLEISKDTGKGKPINVLKGSSLLRAYDRRFYDSTQKA